MTMQQIRHVGQPASGEDCQAGGSGLIWFKYMVCSGTIAESHLLTHLQLPGSWMNLSEPFICPDVSANSSHMMPRVGTRIGSEGKSSTIQPSLLENDLAETLALCRGHCQTNASTCAQGSFHSPGVIRFGLLVAAQPSIMPSI